jgi:AcrR family transcriptional regulator
MRRLAEKVEYTPTALYFYFQNKESLLQELSDVDALALGMEFQKLRRVTDLLERMRRMGEAYVKFALAHPNQYRLLFMTPQPPLPPERSAVHKGDVNQDAYALLLETIREAMRTHLLRPELRDPEQVAQVLWSGVHGYASLILTKRNDPWIDWRPSGQTARLVIDTFIAGLLPPGERGDNFLSRKGRMRIRCGTGFRSQHNSNQRKELCIPPKPPK